VELSNIISAISDFFIGSFEILKDNLPLAFIVYGFAFILFVDFFVVAFNWMHPKKSKRRTVQIKGFMFPRLFKSKTPTYSKHVSDFLSNRTYDKPKDDNIRR